MKIPVETGNHKTLKLLKKPPIDLVLLAVSLGIHLVLKSRTFHWYLSDENIYYYLARDLGFSHLPYRDFFYANPPLLLILLKVSGFLTGWTVLGLRLLPLLAHLAGGGLMFLIFRNRLGLLALVPAWVYWWSYDALRASTHSTGITETLVFGMFSLYLILQRRPGWAGFFWGLACWTKLYAVTLLPGIVLLVYLVNSSSPRQALLLFLRNLAIPVAALAVLGTCVAGGDFWKMNFSYHLAKDVAEDDTGEVFLSVLIRNQATVYILIAASIFAILSRWRPRKGSESAESVRNQASSWRTRLLTGCTEPGHPALWISVGGTLTISVLVFLFLQKKIFDFYLLLFLPGIGFLIAGLLMATPFGLNSGRSRFFRNAFLFFALALLAQSLVPRQYRLFIRDRVSYWDHEIRTFDDLAEWKPLVKPEEILMGDSGTVPVLALMTGARLALGEGDTNYMRFLTGMPTPTQFIAEAEQEGVDWLVVRGTRNREGRFRPSGMFTIEPFWDYASTRFEIHKTLGFGGSRAVVLMCRKIEPDSTVQQKEP